MAPQLKLVIGRQQIGRGISPVQGNYVESIRVQMKMIVENMKRVVDHIDRVTPEAIVFGLEPVFVESQRLVPVDTGDLKRSGFIEARQTSTGTHAEIGYGRFGRPAYAAEVHEILFFRHAPPTQARFLSQAVDTKIDDFRRRIELFYRKTMKGSK